jgi:hypothetical protein
MFCHYSARRTHCAFRRAAKGRLHAGQLLDGRHRSRAEPGRAGARPAGQPPPAGAGACAGSSFSGELTPLDNQRRSGKYEDVYQIDGRRGQRVEITLLSDDFDGYLVVNGPGGYAMFNDDGEGMELGSRLVLELPQDGPYRVSATSFAPGAMGAYRIQAAQAAATATLNQVEPFTPIQFGASIQGRLEQDDARSEGKRRIATASPPSAASACGSTSTRPISTHC